MMAEDAPVSSTQPAPGVAAVGTYLADFHRDAQLRWPANRRLKVVFHGHSVPAGYFTGGKVHTFEAYPHLLHVGLNKKFPSAVISVIVTAVGGENARTGATRFDRDVLTLEPDVVLIDYGLNDRAIGVEAARVAWAEMIDKALARGIRVILLTPTPDTHPRPELPAGALERHAEMIRQLAAEKGVGLVDSSAAFDRAIAAGAAIDSLMSQNNHPNGSGHAIVACELAKWFGIQP